MNLFVAAMLVLVLADDLVVLLLGWEGVGLCSYLLIGFWHDDPANGHAARKAFLVTRVGDTALLIGLFLLQTRLGTLHIPDVLARAGGAWHAGDPVAVAAAALLLGGAVGKSAQLPLQAWLPDAMAGPTPVSALIHAATMVTAGVYLIARLHPLFLLAPPVMAATAWIGAVTLLLAGGSALVQRDIKRVLAYSTISQLGYMFLALGVGAWSAAIFHLMTHAFFKALLFLASGVVIHALHDEHDLHAMGGLRRRLPWAYAAFLAGGAALAGVPLITAGFYSKDLILHEAFVAADGFPWLWLAGLAGVALTAAYILRLILLAFHGRQRRCRGRAPARSGPAPAAGGAVGAGADRRLRRGCRDPWEDGIPSRTCWSRCSGRCPAARPVRGWTWALMVTAAAAVLVGGGAGLAPVALAPGRRPGRDARGPRPGWPDGRRLGLRRPLRRAGGPALGRAGAALAGRSRRCPLPDPRRHRGRPAGGGPPQPERAPALVRRRGGGRRGPGPGGGDAAMTLLALVLLPLARRPRGLAGRPRLVPGAAAGHPGDPGRSWVRLPSSPCGTCTKAAAGWPSSACPGCRNWAARCTWLSTA